MRISDWSSDVCSSDLFPDIDPVAVQIGPLAIRWYALAYIAGILLGWWYVTHLSRRWASPVTVEHLGDFVLWTTLGIVLGGRLGYVLFYNLDRYLADPLQIFVIWRGDRRSTRLNSNH